MQKQSEIALFLAVDEEGGNVSRVLSNLGNREGGTIDPMYEYKDDGTDTAFENENTPVKVDESITDFDESTIVYGGNRFLK